MILELQRTGRRVRRIHQALGGGAHRIGNTQNVDSAVSLESGQMGMRHVPVLPLRFCHT